MDWAVCSKVDEPAPCPLVRHACAVDLPALNVVIERAAMNWPLPARLRKRVIPVLRYDHVDLDCLEIFVYCFAERTVGVLALDFDGARAQDQSQPVTLHGLFIDPGFQRQGLGRKLVAFAEQHARDRARDAISLRAERFSCAFFERCAYTHIPPKSEDDYPYVYCKGGLIRR